MSGKVFLGLTSTMQRIKCLAQGHITVPPMRPEPATSRSRVRHSTREPPSYLYYTIIDFNEVDIRIYLPEKVIIH